MASFEPELGQMMFSNTEWQEHEVPEFALAALEYLVGEIGRVYWNNNQEEFESPTQNTGADYKTDKFKMRAYCWCDGERHKKGCPANFEWRDVKINWYKRLGRGTSSNTQLTPELTATMLEDCLESVRATEKELY